ncbi:hypothetical protein FHY11_000312 [Xanthomonas arboricola]|uniref:hypothetical protein n=1 Tax=Xanthomonas euroxanthea TaxID=2259622 RepID=UPI00141A9607|nr:hypothetical protein [Xanthomonas euroxanthea]NIK06846.1 hypothetical protein [Xanthomonas euroxanthea]
MSQPMQLKLGTALTGSGTPRDREASQVSGATELRPAPQVSMPAKGVSGKTLPNMANQCCHELSPSKTVKANWAIKIGEWAPLL